MLIDWKESILKTKFMCKKSLVGLLLCLAMLFACSEDEPPVEGCTNSIAENYNANATVDNGTCIITGCTDTEAENYNASANVSGDCIFARDKFIGTYFGSISCDQALLQEFDSDSLTFSLIEGLGDEKNSVTLDLIEFAIDAPIDAMADGDELMINNKGVGPYSVDALPGIEFFVDVSGTATLDNDEQILTGSLNFDVINAADDMLILSGTCTLEGEKQ